MYKIFEELCKENGVTPYRVCKETGITTATISNWKAGRYTPKADKMQKIADYFGVSLEYLMIKNLNDTPHALQSLCDFADGLLSQINLIPFNSVDHCSYQSSTEATIIQFQKALTRVGIETTIRNSRGSDIAGACGQLKNKLR